MFKRRAAGFMAAVAIGVSLSLGVSSSAQALVVAPPPVPPVVVGSAASAGGAAVSAGAACVASVVCLGAVGVAAAAVGLYATRDSWVPAIKRWIGGEETTTIPYAGPSPQILHSPSLSGDGRSLTVSITDNRTSGTNAALYQGFQYSCDTAGVVGSWLQANWGSTIAPGVTKSYTINCAEGSQMLAMFSTDYTLTCSNCHTASNDISWSRPGDYPAGSEVYRSTVECVKADGSTESYSVEYQGQANSSDVGFLIPSCSAAGKGTHARSVDVDVRLPGRTDFRDAWSVTPPADPNYPDCDPSLPSSVNCVLQVWVDGVECQVGDSRCLDWQSHAQSRVQCKWGPYTVGISSCDMLERAYRPGGALLTEENIDGNPQTSTGGSPGTDTGTSSFPTEAPIPNDVPAPSLGNPSVGGPGCWPTGSARWNPLEWVQLPVQCALVWAFVPEGGLQTYTDRFGDGWSNSDLGLWVADVGGAAGELGTGVSGASGCEGPVWDITLNGNAYRFAPLDACVPPLSGVAPWVKAAVSALVVLAGVRAVARPITTALGVPGVPGGRDT